MLCEGAAGAFGGVGKGAGGISGCGRAGVCGFSAGGSAREWVRTRWEVRRVRAGGSAGVLATSREHGGAAAGAGVPRAMVPMSAGTRVRASGRRTRGEGSAVTEQGAPPPAEKLRGRFNFLDPH
ncbi:hypothetical protein C8J57DRAFT_1256271 [Mycena rebaudengoi]|nr:hypothetical protein C8J57DRAFT_1256271 [Mycena rebaudengoi]